MCCKWHVQGYFYAFKHPILLHSMFFHSASSFLILDNNTGCTLNIILYIYIYTLSSHSNYTSIWTMFRHTFFSSSFGIHLLILQSSYHVHVLMRKVFHLIGSPLLRCVHEGLKASMIKFYWLSSKLAHIVFLYCTHNILNML